MKNVSKKIFLILAFAAAACVALAEDLDLGGVLRSARATPERAPVVLAAAAAVFAMAAPVVPVAILVAAAVSA